jgi:hypothetical protein
LFEDVPEAGDAEDPDDLLESIEVGQHGRHCST